MVSKRTRSQAMTEMRSVVVRATEPEITPEMGKAGILVLAEQYGVVSEYVAEELGPDVFRAMWSARPD
jgi:hypothetical protein